jgi:hypothetical protein
VSVLSQLGRLASRLGVSIEKLINTLIVGGQDLSHQSRFCFVCFERFLRPRDDRIVTIRVYLQLGKRSTQTAADTCNLGLEIGVLFLQLSPQQSVIRLQESDPLSIEESSGTL